LNGNVSVEISHDPLPQKVENPAPEFQSNGEKRIRLAQSAAEQKLVSAPAPLYPPLAKLAGTQGVVTVAVLIGKEGNVKGVYSMRGPELLRPAAETAVNQWVYRPTLLNGEPIEVISTVDVSFRLEQ
jgi:protein TonB